MVGLTRTALLKISGHRRRLICSAGELQTWKERQDLEDPMRLRYVRGKVQPNHTRHCPRARRRTELETGIGVLTMHGLFLTPTPRRGASQIECVSGRSDEPAANQGPPTRCCTTWGNPI